MVEIYSFYLLKNCSCVLNFGLLPTVEGEGPLSAATLTFPAQQQPGSQLDSVHLVTHQQTAEHGASGNNRLDIKDG